MTSWAKADKEQRVELVAQAYAVGIRRTQRRAGNEDDPSLTKLRLRVDKKWDGSRKWLYIIVNICSKLGINGIEYVRAQFALWPKSDKFPLVPSLESMTGKRALRNYQKWVDAKPLNPAIKPSEKRDRAISESERIVRMFMERNREEYPDTKSALRNPAIVSMLSMAYLNRSPEFQELLQEGYYKRKSA